MKKHFKIITLILSLAVLVAGIVGVTAMASEEEPSLKIFSKNLSYGGTISIAFAVEANGIDEGVELLVYENEPATLDEAPDAVVSSYKIMNVRGKDALVFLTPGIPAKNMTDQVYAVARASDGNGGYIYSGIERYSVAEYAYDVMYYSKLGTEYTELANTLLDLGCQIQNLLPHNVDSDPRDFYYVSMYDQSVGYALDGNYSAGIYKKGDTLTLPEEYLGEVPEGKAFAGYWTSTVNGTTTIVNAGETLTVAGHTVIQPGYTFVAVTPGNGYYYSGDEVGNRYDFSESGADKVVGGSIIDGAFHVTEGNRTNVITNNSEVIFKDGTKYIFEADLTFNGGTPASDDLLFAWAGFSGDDGTTSYFNNQKLFAVSEMSYADAEGSALVWYGIRFEKDVTYNVRLEYLLGDGSYIFYVNNSVVTEGKNSVGQSYVENVDRRLKGFTIYTRSSSYISTLDISLDNVYSAPIPDENNLFTFYNDATTGTKLSFDTDGDLTGIVTDDTHSSNAGTYGAATVKDGKLTVDDDPAWYSIAFKNSSFDPSKTYANGTKYVFEADVTFNGGSSESTTDFGAAFTGFYGNTSTTYRNGDMFSYSYANYSANAENPDACDLDMFGALLRVGETHKVTYIYTVGSNTKLEVYVDGVKIANATLKTNSGNEDTNFHAFGFYIRGTGYTDNLSLTFDNVYLGVFEQQEVFKAF